MGNAPLGGITETRYTHVTNDDIHVAGTLLGSCLAQMTARRVA